MKKTFLLFSLLLPLLSFSQGYEYETGDITLSLTGTFGGNQPHTVAVIDEITGDNLLNQSANGYDLKYKSKGIGVAGAYFINEFLSAGVYINHSLSKAKVSGYYNQFRGVAVDADNDGSFDDRMDRLHSETRKLRSIWTGVNINCHYSHFINSIPDELDLYAGLSLNNGFHFEHVSDIEEEDYYTFNTGTANQTESFQNFIEKDNYTWRPNSTFGRINVSAGARYYFKENLGANVEVGLRDKYLALGVTFKL